LTLGHAGSPSAISAELSSQCRPVSFRGFPTGGPSSADCSRVDESDARTPARMYPELMQRPCRQYGAIMGVFAKSMKRRGISATGCIVRTPMACGQAGPPTTLGQTRPGSIECLCVKCPSARAQWPGALDAGSRERDSTECFGCGWPNRAGCNGLRVIIVNGLGDVKRGRKPRRRVRSSGVREMAVSRLDRDRGPTPPDAASRYGSPRAERPPDPHRLRS
jgi:hypothetical protein